MSAPVPSRQAFIVTTVIIAVIAALAAAGSAALSLPVWAMFIGWIAFFTHIGTTRTAFENLACVGLGIVIGLIAGVSVPELAAVVGPGLALPMVVFAVALIVVALRGLPVMNNLLGYFLGIVAWFAAHLEPSFEGLAQLLSASAVGSVAGWVSHTLPSCILPQAENAGEVL